ncbi:SDR family NAD(P)-dependent oxidoreductase, partial [Vibrio sp. F13]|uniref:SDR family NAD(P)-dependent oxidoreductase n=2 Tax=unclassified Vibrio TaxID=2614977 RepID=UPI0010BE09AA
MFNDLKGKRILITGSTAGMGLATARIFAKYGAKIGINSRASSPKVDDVLSELTALGGDVAF